jgi:hypothetical protein
MLFFIQGTDSSGSITLRRETAAAALKKAAELAEDAVGTLRLPRQTGTNTSPKHSTSYQLIADLTVATTPLRRTGAPHVFSSGCSPGASRSGSIFSKDVHNSSWQKQK